MQIHPSRAAAVALLLTLAPQAVRSATSLTTTLVASGLTRPVYVTSPPGDDRLFILEQRATGNLGRVRIIKAGTLLARPFVTVGPVPTGNEQGLLGMAFAPDYATSGRFYLHYDDAAGTTRIARYTVSADPDSANPTGQIIYSASQPFTNHNGGWLAFGPDGYLWLALGDGGSAGDPGDRAQNVNSQLGKLHRFDVSGNGAAVAAPDNPFIGVTNGLDEIWCFGLRNPWRCSFDRLTGDLVIADVGQDAWEEIDFAPASSSRGKGWDWGWRCYEGNTFYSASATIPCGSCLAVGCDLKFPAWVYSHTGGACSITGGYVYRGCQIPDLQGTYFFADYCSNQIFSGRFSGGILPSVTNRTVQLDPPGAISITSITSFGEDSKGEMYICDQGGEIFKIVASGAVAESDMPTLQVATGLGTLGATSPGNALAPGITAFADAGSRIRGVGYLKNAQIRDCPSGSGNCTTARMKLLTWDYDVTSCVDPDSSTLTRTFVFTNRGGSAAPLAFVDVVTPYLNGDADEVRAFDASTATETNRLALYEPSHPDLYVTLRGLATGAVFAMDADSLVTLAARVAADQPLANRPLAGPTRCAMALSFDFGSVAPGASLTATVVLRLQATPPSDVPPETEALQALSLRALGPMPFQNSLQLGLNLPQAGPIHVDVFDVRGRRVRRLVDGSLEAGPRTLMWDGRDDHGAVQGAGLYFVRMYTRQGERSLRVVRVQ